MFPVNLQEDMQHGYFDDFRAVRDQQGKIFSSPDRLIDAQVAQPFSPTQVCQFVFSSLDCIQCMMPSTVYDSVSLGSS